METRLASCSCGRITASCRGEPFLVSLCNCRACQRQTGSAFGIAAFFDRDKVETRGDTARYTRRSDSGFDVHLNFCPECGSTVFWYPDRKPGSVAVAAGCFADPEAFRPSQSVYEDHKAPWLYFSFE